MTKFSVGQLSTTLLHAMIAVGCGIPEENVAEDRTNVAISGIDVRHAELNSLEERVTAENDVNFASSYFTATEDDLFAPLSFDVGLMRRASTADELQEIAKSRRSMSVLASVSAKASTVTERALAAAAAMPRGALINVAVELADLPFDFKRLRPAEDTDRDAVIAERRAQLRDSQNRLLNKLSAVQGTLLGRMWLLNVLDIQVPAERVADVAAMPEVRAVAVAENSGGPEAGWDGLAIRGRILLDGAGLTDGMSDFMQGCFTTPADPAACHDGSTGSRTNASARQRIALVEWGTFPSRNHVGFRSAGGTSRIISVRDCTSAGCAIAATTANSASHATVTGWVAGGSIESGQDSAFPGTHLSSQRVRSGVGKENSLLFYRVTGTDGARRAIEQAVADGADVINMSWGTARCDSVDTATWDENFINGALANAINAGALPVKSAGNNNNVASTCSITYPAWRPDVLTVGGLETTNANLNMDTTGLMTSEGGTSRGGATLRVRGGTSAYPFSGVGLIAPGCVGNYFNNDSNGYAIGAQQCGTSVAAPIASATAALWRDAVWYFGGSNVGNDARALMVNMLLFGDGWDSDVSTKRTSGIGRVSGFGRIHAHFPATNNVAAPVGWGTQAFTITQGQTLTWTVGGAGAEPSNVTAWKWALTWFDTDLSQASDITISVVDACNGNALVAQDLSFDYRKRIRLGQSQISGRCLTMRATAVAAPPSGTVIFTSDYFTGSSSANTQH